MNANYNSEFTQQKMLQNIKHINPISLAEKKQPQNSGSSYFKSVF